MGEGGIVEGAGNSNSPKEYSFTEAIETSEVFKNLGGFSFNLLYRLKQIDNDGTFTYSDEVEVNLNSKPASFNLSSYPNPFNPETTVRLEIPKLSKVNVSVYNILGEKVITLFEGELEAGIYQDTFSGRNLASGIHIMSLTTDKSISFVKKVMLMK